MSSLPVEFPDPIAIRKEVEEAVRRGDVDGLAKRIVDLSQDRCALQVRVQDLLHERYGQHSEKLRGAQLELVKLADQYALKPSDAAAQPLPQLPALPAPAKPRRKRGGRHRLSPDLPRRRIVLEPPESDRVSKDGTPLRCIGEDVREALHYTPATLVVFEFVSRKYADPEDEPGVVQRSPPLPLTGAIPTAALLAFVIVEKYRWHTPLYRIAQKLKALGADISDDVLQSWCRLAAPLLLWFYSAFEAKTLASHVVSSDDTPTKTQDREAPGNIKRSHIWLHVGEEAVVFQYTPDWSGELVRRVLEKHKGPLQSDGYKGLDRLFGPAAPSTRKRVGCMMHFRRGFIKALDAEDQRAAAPLALLVRLYEVEDYADELGARGAERKTIRDTYSRPVMAALKRWLDEEGGHAVPKSPLGKAVSYGRNQWPTLVQFLEDGDIPIDNGRVERGLRQVGRGRVAWLFFGSDEAGKRAAIFMTCIANCVKHGVDPEAWLTDIFTKLGEGANVEQPELLPAAWAKAHKQTEDPQQHPAA